jgi:hypothetical protein
MAKVEVLNFEELMSPAHENEDEQQYEEDYEDENQA